MKIAYITGYNAKNARMWSGTGYFIVQALASQNLDLDYIGPLINKILEKLY